MSPGVEFFANRHKFSNCVDYLAQQFPELIGPA